MIETDHPFEDSITYADDLDSSFNELLSYVVEGMDEFITYLDSVYPSFTTTDHDSLETCTTNFSGATSNNKLENSNFSFHVNDTQLDDSSLDLEEYLDLNMSIEIEDMKDWLEGGEESTTGSHQVSINQEGNSWTMISSDASMQEISVQPALILPTEDMELDNELGANHLAQAFAEAMEKEQRELADVIVRRINDKISPVGEIKERLLYHSFQPLDEKADSYLRQECSKIFDAAFDAIYRTFPNGMLAHFRANSAILEAIPHDAEVSHIVDFDMGEGVQWASFIVALAQRQNLLQQFGLLCQKTTLKLTSIMWKNENCSNASPPRRFEEAKERLLDYADFHGLKLEIEEMELQDLASQIKKAKKRGGWRQWLAFNCMRALPHMGRRRSRKHVIEFLKGAQDLITNPANDNKTSNSGIIIYGDGETWGKAENYSCFRLFFDSHMKHYEAMLESMEWKFPTRFAEAKIAMECLFVAPYLSSFALLEEWMEIKEGCDFQPGFGLQGVRSSSESLMEAKLLVTEGHKSLYSVRIEGENANEMVLLWREAPLVRVSVWRP